MPFSSVRERGLVSILERYQELTDGTVLRPESLPETKITVNNPKPCRDEAIHAGQHPGDECITIEPQGNKFMKAVAERRR